MNENQRVLSVRWKPKFYIYVLECSDVMFPCYVARGTGL